MSEQSKSVKELVEETAEHLRVCFGSTFSHEDYIATAKLLLSHPDLALIDRGQIGERPLCPQCGLLLKTVRQDDNSLLNREQFDSVKAGDWYCDNCKGNEAERTYYKYWWDKELSYIRPRPYSVIPLAEALKGE